MDIEDRAGTTAANGGGTTTAVAGSDSSSLDVSQRSDIGQLKKAAVGLGGVLFISFAAMSPLTGQLGNVPIAIGLGNGIGAPAGFEIGIVMLALFCVGYLQMLQAGAVVGRLLLLHQPGARAPARHGRRMVVGHGLCGHRGLAARCVLVLRQHHDPAVLPRVDSVAVFSPSGHWSLIGILGHFDVRLNSTVLGVALILEMLVLAVMVIAVFAHGGGPTGISAAPINPVNAFKGLAPGVGIFFAVWSWVGFETIPNYAEESKNPQAASVARRCSSASSAAACSSWSAPGPAVTRPGPARRRVAPGGHQRRQLLLRRDQQFAAPWVTDVMEWLIMTSSFACALSFHNTTSRYLYVIGREKIFHPGLGRTHRGGRAPTSPTPSPSLSSPAHRSVPRRSGTPATPAQTFAPSRRPLLRAVRLVRDHRHVHRAGEPAICLGGLRSASSASLRTVDGGTSGRRRSSPC